MSYKCSIKWCFCCCSVAQSCPAFWELMEWSMPGFPVLHHLPDLAQTHVLWVSDAIKLPHPLSILLLLPSVSSNESVLHIRWSNYWSFSLSITPSYEHSELISFRMDWLDLLAVQGNLKTLLQHHGSKATILQLSAFFKFQFSHPYMMTGKSIICLYGPLSAKWCLCFLICYLGSSWLFFQEASIF